MTQESTPNAPVGHTGPDVRRILDDAQRLCRQLAGPELGSTPLYFIPQSQLPVGLDTKHHYAFTHPRADLMYREHITPWLGRGPCAVINDIAIEEDYGTEDLEYLLHCAALHEFAHILDRPTLYNGDDYNAARIHFEALVLNDCSKRASPLVEVPLYYGHGPSFIRLVIHLAYRASRIGFDVRPAGIFAAHHLGLSPVCMYADALGDETYRCLELSFRELLETYPDVEFMQLWDADMNRYEVRFPRSQGAT